MGRPPLKKLALVAALVAAIVAFKTFGLDSYLTFEYLQQSQARFRDYYTANALPVIALYLLVYIIATALSLPGATILTLMGGAMFGLMVGILVVSFASSIGATLAFLVSRFVLRDWVQGKFGARLEAVNRGMEAEGAFYLFTIRLIPVLPFFIVNLVMGLTKMKAVTYYWVSQLGMLAGTMVYVNAGNQIGRLESASGILSPQLIASFVLLGLLPLISKKIINAYRNRGSQLNVGEGDK